MANWILKDHAYAEWMPTTMTCGIYGEKKKKKCKTTLIRT